jgi:hypothetical protein
MAVGDARVMRINVLSTIAVMLACLCGAAAGPRAAQAQMPSEGKIALEQFLGDLGEACDCYFTVEDGYKAGDSAALLSSFMVGRPRKGPKLEEQLKALKSEVPDLTFTADEKNPRIIHIADKRLSGEKGYALDGVVREIDFKGTVVGLIAAIQAQGFQISSPTSLATEELLSWDLSTPVRVKAKEIKVREALSLYLPLGRYSRVLWVARTNVGAGMHTQVMFRGPRK